MNCFIAYLYSEEIYLKFIIHSKQGRLNISWSKLSCVVQTKVNIRKLPMKWFIAMVFLISQTVTLNNFENIGHVHSLILNGNINIFFVVYFNFSEINMGNQGWLCIFELLKHDQSFYVKQLEIINISVLHKIGKCKIKLENVKN